MAKAKGRKKKGKARSRRRGRPFQMTWARKLRELKKEGASAADIRRHHAYFLGKNKLKRQIFG